MERLPNEERWSDLGLFSMGERKLRGDPINICKYVKGGGRQMGEGRLFLAVCSDRTRSSSLELERRELCSAMQKNCFMVRVLERWNGLPREVVQFPSVEIFKIHLGTDLCDLL